MLFPYNERLMVSIIKDNINRFGYVTRNTAILFWNTDTIQKKVDFGIEYFNRLAKGRNDLYNSVDIKNEMYLILCDSLAGFSHEKNTCFASYYNTAVNHRIQRIFQSNVNPSKNNVSFKYFVGTTQINDSQTIVYELKKSQLFDNSEIELIINIIDSPDEIIDLQGFDIEGLKKKLKIFFINRQKNKCMPKANKTIEGSINNYLDRYSYTGQAVRDEKGEIIINTDGLCFAFDNLPGSDFAIKEGETYKVTIEWVKTPSKSEIAWQ